MSRFIQIHDVFLGSFVNQSGQTTINAENICSLKYRYVDEEHVLDIRMSNGDHHRILGQTEVDFLSEINRQHWPYR